MQQPGAALHILLALLAIVCPGAHANVAACQAAWLSPSAGPSLLLNASECGCTAASRPCFLTELVLDAAVEASVQSVQACAVVYGVPPPQGALELSSSSASSWTLLTTVNTSGVSAPPDASAASGPPATTVALNWNRTTAAGGMLAPVSARLFRAAMKARAGFMLSLVALVEFDPAFAQQISTRPLTAPTCSMTPRPCAQARTSSRGGLCADVSINSTTARLSCMFGEGATCVSCPTGALCPGGDRVWPVADYWAPNMSQPRVQRCMPTLQQRCAGVNTADIQALARLDTSTSSTCSRGYTGYACTACAAGFYPRAADGACAPCTTSVVTRRVVVAAVPLITAVFLGAIALGTGCVHTSMCGATAQPLSTATVAAHWTDMMTHVPSGAPALPPRQLVFALWADLGRICLHHYTTLLLVSQVSVATVFSVPPGIDALVDAFNVLRAARETSPTACLQQLPLTADVTVLVSAVVSTALVAACVTWALLATSADERRSSDASASNLPKSTGSTPRPTAVAASPFHTRGRQPQPATGFSSMAVAPRLHAGASSPLAPAHAQRLPKVWHLRAVLAIGKLLVALLLLLYPVVVNTVFDVASCSSAASLPVWLYRTLTQSGGAAAAAIASAPRARATNDQISVTVALLASDPSIVCFESPHFAAYSLAIFTGIVVCVVAPMLMAGVVLHRFLLRLPVASVSLFSAHYRAVYNTWCCPVRASMVHAVLEQGAPDATQLRAYSDALDEDPRITSDVAMRILHYSIVHDSQWRHMPIVRSASFAWTYVELMVFLGLAALRALARSAVALPLPEPTTRVALDFYQALCVIMSTLIILGGLVALSTMQPYSRAYARIGQSKFVAYLLCIALLCMNYEFYANSMNMGDAGSSTTALSVVATLLLVALLALMVMSLGAAVAQHLHAAAGPAVLAGPHHAFYEALRTVFDLPPIAPVAAKQVDGSEPGGIGFNAALTARRRHSTLGIISGAGSSSIGGGGGGSFVNRRDIMNAGSGRSGRTAALDAAAGTDVPPATASRSRRASVREVVHGVSLAEGRQQSMERLSVLGSVASFASRASSPPKGGSARDLEPAMMPVSTRLLAATNSSVSVTSAAHSTRTVFAPQRRATLASIAPLLPSST